MARRPPLEARLATYALSKTELTLLRAMVEKSKDGLGYRVFASFETLAAWAKCCTKTVDRLINGWVDTRNGRRHDGFLKRGILVRRDGAYDLNEAALSIDPRVKAYFQRRRRPAVQMNLPGIAQPAPATPSTDRTPCPSNTGHGVQQSPDTVSIYPKALGDPKAFDPGVFAEALIEAIQRSPYPLVATVQLQRAVAGSFQALITGGESPPDAFEFLLAVTLDGIQRGKTINRFWFEDAKWRQADDTQQISRSAARVANQLRAAPDAVRGYRAATNGDHRRTYEN
jgi:hypothetical protein